MCLEFLKINDSDNYIIYDGNIYDVGNWIEKHPAGPRLIQKFIGRDCTDVFDAVHPPKARFILERYKVGLVEKKLWNSSVSAATRTYRHLRKQLAKGGVFDADSKYLVVRLAFMACFFVCGMTLAIVLGDCIVGAGLSGLCIGFMWVRGFYLHHDFVHANMTQNPNLDRLIRLIVVNCTVGYSFAWWKESHLHHHIFTNFPDDDPDTSFVPLVALNKQILADFFEGCFCFYRNAKYKINFLSRITLPWQHLTFFPSWLLFVRPLMWYATLGYLFIPRWRRSKHTTFTLVQELTACCLFFLWYLPLVFSFNTLMAKIVFLAAAHLTIGFMHFEVLINHLPLEIISSNDEKSTSSEFVHHQLQSTANVLLPDWKWIHFFSGNTFFKNQIEHHLFPRASPAKIHVVTDCVRKLCKDHNLPFQEIRLGQGASIIYQKLKLVAADYPKLLASMT